MAYSTDWKVILPTAAGWQVLSTTSTTQQHDLGQIVTAVDRGANSNGQGDFIYLKGVADTTAGSWVTYNADDYSTALLGADMIGPVAVAMAPTVAGQYGWYQIRGKAVAKAGAGFADNGNVYATATGGTADDAVVAGDRVKNAKGASAIDFPATGYAEFELNHPFVDDAVAA